LYRIYWSIVKFGLLAAAIGPALSAIGKMSMGISALTGLLEGLGIAAATAAGKIALITGAVWLFYQAVQDAKKGQDSLGAASGILGYNMQNLKRDIDDLNTSLKQQTVEYQRVANSRVSEGSSIPSNDPKIC